MWHLWSCTPQPSWFLANQQESFRYKKHTSIPTSSIPGCDEPQFACLVVFGNSVFSSCQWKQHLSWSELVHRTLIPRIAQSLSLSLCVYLHNECCDNKYLWVCGLRSNFCKLLWGFSSSEILLALILCPEVFSGVVLSKFFWRIRLVCTKSQYQTHPHWFWLHLLLWYLQIVIVEIISVQFHICCTIIKWFLLEFLRFYKNPSFKRRKTMTFFPQVL